MSHINPGKCDVMTATGNYSCLTADLGLKHEPSFKVGLIYRLEAIKKIYL